jgi:hypothetical protein
MHIYIYIYQVLSACIHTHTNANTHTHTAVRVYLQTIEALKKKLEKLKNKNRACRYETATVTTAFTKIKKKNTKKPLTQVRDGNGDNSGARVPAATRCLN